jgi:hypothetical protein
VVFLIDESTAMEARVAGGTKAKAECVATAVNSLLNQLGGGPSLDVALVGYRSRPGAQADIGSRWDGPLAGRQFVNAAQLAASPLAVETRLRKVPAADGTIREEQVRFPVWYRPTLGPAVPRRDAYDGCRRLLSDWVTSNGGGAKPPLVISLLGELGEQESLLAASEGLRRLACPGGSPWLFHVHLGTLARMPATLYPSSDVHLATTAMRDLFAASTPLPSPLVAALQQAQVKINAAARGAILNAQMADLVRFLSLTKAYAAYRPPVASLAVAETPARIPEDKETRQAAAAESRADSAGPGSEASSQPAPSTVLIVLLLDRSVSDPSQKEKCVWLRLQEQANELLAQIAKRTDGKIEVAVVAYGGDGSGATAIETGLRASPSGDPWIRDADLSAAVMRIAETTEQVSNGIGGLVAVHRKRPVYIDLESTTAADPRPAFAAVKDLLDDWYREHAGQAALPIVLHLTRGQFAAEALTQAVVVLRQVAGTSPLLHHLIRTESPHASLAYPADASLVASPECAQVWEQSSLLLGRQTLALRRPAISEQSRGIVINGKFDLLLEAIDEALKSKRE